MGTQLALLWTECKGGAVTSAQCTIIAHVLHLTIFITYFLEKQEYINVCKNLFEIHLFISWMQLVQLLWKDAANKPRTENALQRERRERDENEVQNMPSRNKCQVYGLQHSLHLHGTISKFIIYDVVYFSDLILDLPWALPLITI